MIHWWPAIFGESGSGRTYWFDRVWDIHWIWIVLVGLAMFFFVGSIYFRERGRAAFWIRSTLTLLRFAIIGLVLVVSLGWMRFGAETDLPDLIIAIDDSGSMSHVDTERSDSPSGNSAPAGGASSRPSRIESVKKFLLEQDGNRLAQLQDRYNVKLMRVGERAESVTGDIDDPSTFDQFTADGATSRLGENLQFVIDQQRGRPTAVIVLFSDGITTEGLAVSDVATSARQRNVPLMIIGVGDERPIPDLSLSDLRVDEVVFVDDLVFFQVQLRAVGMQGNQATVRLRKTGAAAPVAEQSVDLTSDDQVVAVSLTDRPDKEGEFDYTVEVVPAPGEIDLTNNELKKRIQVRDEIIRVLLVDDQPSYEFRYLKELLGRGLSRSPADRRRKLIELTSVLQQAQLEYADVDENAARIFPVDRNELFEFDVILLLDVRPEGVAGEPGGLNSAEIQNIADFVTERGGGLVMICGDRFLPNAYQDSPLEPLLPFAIDEITAPAANEDLTEPTRIEATDLGLTLPPLLIEDSAERSARRFDELEGPFWFLRVNELAAGVLDLARIRFDDAGTAQTWPAIAMQRIGPGRVLTHMFDESYRWRVFPDDTTYQRYWIQAIRYLSRHKLRESAAAVELSTGRQEYRAGEPVDVYARYFDPRSLPADAAVQATIVHSDDTTDTLELYRAGRETANFEGSIRSLKPGYYRVVLAGDFGGAKNPTDDFTVLEPDDEMTNLQLNSADLRLAGQISRGWFDRLENADELWQELPAGKQVHVAAIPPRRLWEFPWLAALFGATFILLITGEWLLRKKVGMI